MPRDGWRFLTAADPSIIAAHPIGDTNWRGVVSHCNLPGAEFRWPYCFRLMTGTKRMLRRGVTRLARAGAHCSFHVEVLTRSCSIRTKDLISVYRVKGESVSKTDASSTLVATTNLVTFVNSTERSDAQILRRIDSLSLSADAKALLADLLKFGTDVGNVVLRIGRKVLDFALSLIQQFPQLGFAVVLAAVLATLLSMVPVLGGLLCPILTPLALVLGVSWGALKEYETGDLADRVKEFAARFAPVAA